MKSALLIGLGFTTMGAVIVWQEVRIRDLEAARPPEANASVSDAALPRPPAPAPPVLAPSAEVLALERSDRVLAVAKRKAASADVQAEAEVEIALSDPAEPEVEKKLSDLVAREVDRRESERRERRRERMIERLKESVAAFVESNALDEETHTRLDAMMVAEREQIFSLFGAARSGELPFSEAIEKIRALRAETDENVKALVDDDVFTAYEQQRAEERGPWNRRR